MQSFQLYLTLQQHLGKRLDALLHPLQLRQGHHQQHPCSSQVGARGSLPTLCCWTRSHSHSAHLLCNRSCRVAAEHYPGHW